MALVADRLACDGLAVLERTAESPMNSDLLAFRQRAGTMSSLLPLVTSYGRRTDAQGQTQNFDRRQRTVRFCDFLAESLGRGTFNAVFEVPVEGFPGGPIVRVCLARQHLRQNSTALVGLSERWWFLYSRSLILILVTRERRKANPARSISLPQRPPTLSRRPLPTWISSGCRFHHA